MKELSLYKILNESFEYPEAGLNAQPEVKKAIDRWRKLPDDKKKDQPLLYWLLGAGTPPYKMSKNDSLYIEESEIKDQRCGNCQFAYRNNSNGNFICSKVRGDIKPDAWCKLWKKAENPEFDVKED